MICRHLARTHRLADGELLTSAERSHAAEHVLRCADCQRVVRAVLGLRRLARELASLRGSTIH